MALDKSKPLAHTAEEPAVMALGVGTTMRSARGANFHPSLTLGFGKKHESGSVCQEFTTNLFWTVGFDDTKIREKKKSVVIDFSFKNGLSFLPSYDLFFFCLLVGWVWGIWFSSPDRSYKILHLVMEAHYPNCDKLFVFYDYFIVNRKFNTGTRSTTHIFSLIKNYGKKSGHKGFNSLRYNILIQFSTIKVLLIFSCFPYRVRAQSAWRATGKPSGPMFIMRVTSSEFGGKKLKSQYLLSLNLVNSFRVNLKENYIECLN